MSNDAKAPQSRGMTGLSVFGSLLLVCLVIGSMWWFMVGNQPHVLTFEEQMQQANAELAKAQNAKMQSEEALRLVIEVDTLRSLPNPTEAQRARISECITRIGVLDPSLVYRVDKPH